jgi:hypothetical protein
VVSDLGDPDTPIGEETYRAVLGTVFDNFLAELMAIEALEDAELARRPLPEPATKDDLEARMDAALRAHRVSSEQMAYFALENPDVVQSVEADNSARMHEIQSSIHRIRSRVRARGIQTAIASITIRERP